MEVNVTKNKTEDISSSNFRENKTCSNKVQIVEDWLLGVKPKCMYSLIQSVAASQSKNTLCQTYEKTDHQNDFNMSDDDNNDDEDYDSIKDPDYNPSTPSYSIQGEISSMKINTTSSNQKHIIREDLIPEKSESVTVSQSKTTYCQIYDQTDHENNFYVSYEKDNNSDDHHSTRDPNYNPPDNVIQSEISSTKDNITSSLEVPVASENLLSKNLQDMVEVVSRKNYTDRRDFCIYCERDVSHFARHMTSWHEQEFDVQRILSLKSNSLARRQALSILRKRGNFLRNRPGTKLLPVKRLQAEQKYISSDSFLPCKYCLGFYKKKSLFRHTKICHANYDNGEKRQNSQSDGQTTLLLYSTFKYEELLKSKIFPRMRADDISLTAKQDPLICKYAYSYIKGRQSKGNVDLVRQNMRRLAKLLIYARSENNNIKKFIDILRPSYFQLIIAGVNKMAQYNPETEFYSSPTLAINFGTLIKKCCDLAYVDLLQIADTTEQRKDLKILKRLIESQWADEISAQAGSNLNQNKWNKEELLPLTSDLKKLNLFLQKTSNEAFNNLKADNGDIKAYNKLKELLYTQIILLNRRRPAEVAQLKIQTYKSINLETDNNNEFEKCLTETEKILLSTYSRFLIRGKRGRGVPVLFSPEMKKQFDFLLQVRHNFVSENDFVFHTSGKNFIDGTKILHKYVTKCKVERPSSITATRLRKHLATITQLLQFSNIDMEQLSKFMGHTLKTHCSVYRMSDKIYQTAKISKLLLLMMEGGAEEFRGKSLDEINIDLSPIYDNETEIENMNSCLNYEEADFQTESTPKNDQKQKTMKFPTIQKRESWTTVQKNIIAEYFLQHIQEKKPPKRHEIEMFSNNYPELFKGKKWTSIKAVVFNMYSGKLKY